MAPGKKFRFKNKLLSLDSTVIELCATMFDWARYGQTKGAVKLHLLLDHDGYPAGGQHHHALQDRDTLSILATIRSVGPLSPRSNLARVA